MLKNKKKIKYFVSYSGVKGGFTVFGNIDVTLHGKCLGGIEDVLEIEKQVAASLELEQVVAMNWRRFDS